MDLGGKVIVVTGGGSGIGAAMARRFADEGPSALVVADLDGAAAEQVASEVSCAAIEVDVSDEVENARLVDAVETRYGPIDLFCANAGIGFPGDEQSPAETWDRMWRVNVLSHIFAAKQLIPGWVERGDGYFLSTASAAGLLTNLKAAEYSVTKHAAVAFSEWLAVTYGDLGVKVSCLCPQGVRTPLMEGSGEFRKLLEPVALEPEEVADAVVEGLATERFLILPHPEVAGYFLNKATDYDRWIAGMRRLQDRVFD